MANVAYIDKKRKGKRIFSLYRLKTLFCLNKDFYQLLRSVQFMLVEHNIYFLQQGINFLKAIDADAYTKPSIDGKGGGIGPHFRHCIEHYESLIHGVESRKIDYDARKRDPVVERAPKAAIAKIKAIIDNLHSLADLIDEPCRVKMDSGAHQDHNQTWVNSTFGRELLSVISHTVHHYAIIAILARYYNEPIAEDFGVAPSTLRHLAEK